MNCPVGSSKGIVTCLCVRATPRQQRALKRGVVRVGRELAEVHVHLPVHDDAPHQPCNANRLFSTRRRPRSRPAHTNPLTEDQLGVPVDDVRGADVHQLDAATLKRRQRRVHVVHVVHSHAPALALLLGCLTS